ncbi:MAG: hypothetical protein M3Z08_18200 [Chloroflexota bacterium]|nr:hypothetical protein [Chloroflexota bacterium]
MTMKTSLIAQFLGTLPDFLTITLLASILLLVVFGGIRLVRLPSSWVIISIGGLLLIYSIGTILSDQSHGRPIPLPAILARGGSMAGLVSMVAALYASDQWTARVWYVWMKRRTGRWFSTVFRLLLLFLRQYHQLFGWAVLAIVTLHALLYIPLLLTLSVTAALTQPAVLTGLLAWSILTFLVELGVWVEFAIRHKRVPPRARLVHSLTALGFFLLTLMHVGTRLVVR